MKKCWLAEFGLTTKDFPLPREWRLTFEWTDEARADIRALDRTTAMYRSQASTEDRPGVLSYNATVARRSSLPQPTKRPRMAYSSDLART